MLKIAIVGATGIVGQQAIVSLLGHPGLKSPLVASERSAEKKYIDALKDANGSFAGGAPNCLRISPAWLWKKRPGLIRHPWISFFRLWTRVRPRSWSRNTRKPPRSSAPRRLSAKPTLRSWWAASIWIMRRFLPFSRKTAWEGLHFTQINCTIAGLVVSLKPILDNFWGKTGRGNIASGHVGAGPPAFRHGYDRKCRSLHTGRRAES